MRNLAGVVALKGERSRQKARSMVRNRACCEETSGKERIQKSRGSQHPSRASGRPRVFETLLKALLMVKF